MRLAAARRETSLARFAALHGMQFSIQPAASRRRPAVFRRQHRRTPVGWFGVPGPTGFEVGQHVSLEHLDTADNGASVTRWTWVVFTLRSDDAIDEATWHDLQSMLPRRWSAERCEDELVLYAPGWRRLRSRALWRFAEDVRRRLGPLLARPVRTSSSAERQRHGIRLSIER